MTHQLLPPARSGVTRFKILVVKPGVRDVIEPLLDDMRAGLDLGRLRADWWPSSFITRDTLHVTTVPLENVLSAGYGKHVVSLADAFQSMGSRSDGRTINNAQR